MFNFIKNLFAKREPKESTVKVNSKMELITDELLISSFVTLLKNYRNRGFFKKDYQCIGKFISSNQVPDLSHPFTMDELRSLDTQAVLSSYYSLGIIKFAKRYSLLSCKCIGDPEFDAWMAELAKVTV